MCVLLFLVSLIRTVSMAFIALSGPSLLLPVDGTTGEQRAVLSLSVSSAQAFFSSSPLLWLVLSPWNQYGRWCGRKERAAAACSKAFLQSSSSAAIVFSKRRLVVVLLHSLKVIAPAPIMNRMTRGRAVRSATCNLPLISCQHLQPAANDSTAI